MSLSDAFAKIGLVSEQKRREADAGKAMTTSNVDHILAAEQIKQQKAWQDMTSATSLRALRDMIRHNIPRWPDLDMELLRREVFRFFKDPDYDDLVARLNAIEQEMKKPEFDTSNPKRLGRWVNYMFSPKFSPPTTWHDGRSHRGSGKHPPDPFHFYRT